ncbi:hypothetical protein TNCV_564631 [Trichonephila clavipes]|nr:hypothetical protein TNCV_564631 [Trichonephila clavipes]
MPPWLWRIEIYNQKIWLSPAYPGPSGPLQTPGPSGPLQTPGPWAPSPSAQRINRHWVQGTFMAKDDPKLSFLITNILMFFFSILSSKHHSLSSICGLSDHNPHLRDH